MIRLQSLFMGAVVIARSVSVSAGGETHNWSYAGANGPSRWAALDHGYAACASKSQSPIEIASRDVQSGQLPTLIFRYRPTSLRIVDNGHTIQATVDPGSWLTVGGKTYELIQFHFHRPSEEVIDGKRFPMDAHLVHRDAQGHLAVVAIPLRLGTANALIETLWGNLPPGKDKTAVNIAAKLDGSALLPPTLGYYAYAGSLTTPPCSEGVRWLLLKKPTAISDRQVRMFVARYPNNARPVQPRNGRAVLSSE
jgi:carbonic anhydrase